MRLFVVTKQDEVIPIEAQPNDSILRLQALVVERQCLEFNNIILDHSRTVQSYNIAPDSLLHLRTREPATFNLYIRIFGGRMFTVKVQRIDTLAHVKQLIQLQEPAFPVHYQLLFRNGNLLEGDERSLMSFQITNDSLLDLGYRMTPTTPAPNIGIAINTGNKIADLKEKIFKHTNITPATQSLTFNGTTLSDEKIVGDYNI
ncbi:hypothetical protein BC941DRAFT_366716, partial [Chlamydoabsidia padenii]